MRLSFFDQFIIGFWLSAAAVLAIQTQSWNAGAVPLLLGAFTLLPTYAARVLRSQNRLVRNVAIGVLVLWALAFLTILANAVERLYYVNGKSYPSWLTSGELQPAADGANSLDSLRAGQCKGRGPLEISEKEDGVYLVRCGLFWYEAKTFRATFNPMSKE